MEPKYGLTLSSEEHPPARLVELAVAAEDAGFDSVSSDHYHRWLSTQGHSPFVWSVLGAISQAPSKIEDQIPCGPDTEPIISGIKEAVAGGGVCLHQIGDPLQGFLDAGRDEIEPAL